MRPARIVSWRGCFFKGLVRLMSGPLSRSPDQCLVIFPHHRPARYLKARLAEDPDLAKPLILPRMVSFQDLTAELRRRLVDRPLARLDRAARPGLDQVGLVYEIVRDLRATGRGLLAELPLDWERFLPWGERLAALLEEFLRHGLDPDNLGHMKDEVPDFAAALLEHLGAIHEQYAARLLERGQTTRGLDCALIARDPERAAEILAGKKIFIAGFYALSGAEDALFKRLWSGCGAEVVWHSDPALAGSGKAHWAVAEHAAWLKRWAMRAELVGPSGSGPEPAIRFHQGFDLHSQLAALAEELEAPAGRTAVVLPDAAALGPALHHLPKRDINISMGYPLDRSALHQLLENIMALQERRAESGAYERRDLAELLRHPYLKMLDSGTGQWLRPVFRLWEAELRNSGPMSDPLGWLPDYGSEALAQVPAQEAEALRLEVVGRCLTEFEDLNSLKDLARAVEGLIRLLRDRGGDLWARYLIDAECLARLESDVLPELAASRMSRERLSGDILFSMLRRLCAAQRVPFEPEPLTGLQVLGLLETRLLGFDKVLILDAQEEKLPGAARHDPLLPDAMRHMLGLPDTGERDNVAAYNFYRLIQGSSEAVLIYQSGTQAGVLDSKSLRSRFVEQLLWDLEKRRGTLIEPGSEPLRAVAFKVGPVPSLVPGLPKTQAMADALLRLLTQKSLSVSMLEDYVQCPKKFFYRCLAKLRPLQEPGQENEKAALGSLVHRVLRDFLAPFKDRRVSGPDLDHKALAALYDQALERDESLKNRPLDMRVALAVAGRARLTGYLKAMPETTVRHLEHPVSAGIAPPQNLGLPETVTLMARLDRVDERDRALLVLDYKTGGLPKPDKGFWTGGRADLWEAMRGLDPAENADPALLAGITAASGGLQLPAYLHLLARSTPESEVREACWVELANQGQEVYLFGPKVSAEQRRRAIDRLVPEMIGFCLRHMVLAREFAAAPGRQCEYCDFSGPCGR